MSNINVIHEGQFHITFNNWKTNEKTVVVLEAPTVEAVLPMVEAEAERIGLTRGSARIFGDNVNMLFLEFGHDESEEEWD